MAYTARIFGAIFLMTAVLTVVASVSEIDIEQQLRYFEPEKLDITPYSKFSASSTCGLKQPENFCLVTVTGPKTGHACEGVCDGRFADSAHNITNAQSHSPELWWKSENGVKRVTVTVSMNQEVYVTAVVLKAGPSPRPQDWKLERSVDHGRSFRPWLYFTTEPDRCRQLFRTEANLLPERDDQVLCEARPLQDFYNEEIIIQLLQGRPTAKTFKTSRTLQSWLKATDIRFTFLTINRFLIGNLYNDSSSRRHQFYTLKDLKVIGDCVCHGFAEQCFYDEKVARLQCVCGHNTCGLNCEQCCPGYKQYRWQPASDANLVGTCKACNCFGHSTTCEYNATVEQKHLSLNSEGYYSGGGTCFNCSDNTDGVNCERCKPGYHRMSRKSPLRTTGCKECRCNKTGSANNACNENDGQCLCRKNIAGRQCDRCADGHYGFPRCQHCECFKMGSTSGICNQLTGQCPCVNGTVGRRCDTCPTVDRHLMTTAGCLECQGCSLNVYREFGNHVTEVTPRLVGLLGELKRQDANYRRNKRAEWLEASLDAAGKFKRDLKLSGAEKKVRASKLENIDFELLEMSPLRELQQKSNIALSMQSILPLTISMLLQNTKNTLDIIVSSRECIRTTSRVLRDVAASYRRGVCTSGCPPFPVAISTSMAADINTVSFGTAMLNASDEMISAKTRLQKSERLNENRREFSRLRWRSHVLSRRLENAYRLAVNMLMEHQNWLRNQTTNELMNSIAVVQSVQKQIVGITELVRSIEDNLSFPLKSFWNNIIKNLTIQREFVARFQRTLSESKVKSEKSEITMRQNHLVLKSAHERVQQLENLTDYVISVLKPFEEKCKPYKRLIEVMADTRRHLASAIFEAKEADKILSKVSGVTWNFGIDVARYIDDDDDDIVQETPEVTSASTSTTDAFDDVVDETGDNEIIERLWLTEERTLQELKSTPIGRDLYEGSGVGLPLVSDDYFDSEPPEGGARAKRDIGKLVFLDDRELPTKHFANVLSQARNVSFGVDVSATVISTNKRRMSESLERLSTLELTLNETRDNLRSTNQSMSDFAFDSREAAPYSNYLLELAPKRQRFLNELVTESSGAAIYFRNELDGLISYRRQNKKATEATAAAVSKADESIGRFASAIEKVNSRDFLKRHEQLKDQLEAKRLAVEKIIARCKNTASKFRIPLRFTAPGFIRVDMTGAMPSQFYHGVDVTLWINPNTRNGHILHLGTGNSQDECRFKLILVDSRLVLHLSEGGHHQHSWKLSHPVHVKTQRWIQVGIKWMPHKVTLSQKDTTSEVSEESFNLQPEVDDDDDLHESRTFARDLLVGGIIRNSGNADSDDLTVLPDFDGCIGPVVLNGRNIDLRGFLLSEGHQASCTTFPMETIKRIDNLRFGGNDVINASPIDNQAPEKTIQRIDDLRFSGNDVIDASLIDERTTAGVLPLEFTFRSIQSDSLILMAEDGHLLWRLMVKLVDGYVVFDYQAHARERLILQSALQYNDGEPHLVKITSDGSSVTLAVNTTDRNDVISKLNFAVIGQHRIYLGGSAMVGRRPSGTLPAPYSSPYDDNNNFTGCLIGLTVAKRSVTVAGAKGPLDASLLSCPAHLATCVCLTGETVYPVQVKPLGFFLKRLNFLFRLDRKPLASSRTSILFYSTNSYTRLEVTLSRDFEVRVDWTIGNNSRDGMQRTETLGQVAPSTWNLLSLRNSQKQKGRSLLRIGRQQLILPRDLFSSVGYASQNLMFLGGDSIRRIKGGLTGICYDSFRINDELKDFGSHVIGSRLNGCNSREP